MLYTSVDNSPFAVYDHSEQCLGFHTLILLELLVQIFSSVKIFYLIENYVKKTLSITVWSNDENSDDLVQKWWSDETIEHI